MKANNESFEIQEPEIKRLPFAKLESLYYNRFYEEDGILLNFETEGSIHSIKLNREEARTLAMRLSDADFEWRYRSDVNNLTHVTFDDEPD